MKTHYKANFSFTFTGHAGFVLPCPAILQDRAFVSGSHSALLPLDLSLHIYLSFLLSLFVIVYLSFIFYFLFLSVRYTVATKIIQQAITLFFPTLYLLYSKSYGSRVFIYLYHKVSSICMISCSSIDQTVHFLLKKKIITYNFSPSKIIQQVTFWDRKR